MTPYVQREVFRAFEQVIWRRAVCAVDFVNAGWGNELRCHELTRAVHKLLDVPVMSVVDGKLHACEHSWLQIVVPIADVDRHLRGDSRTYETHEGRWMRKIILDVYVPGRLPQVQLIDPFVLLGHGYAESEPRTDINTEIVDAVYNEMRKAWLASL